MCVLSFCNFSRDLVSIQSAIFEALLMRVGRLAAVHSDASCTGKVARAREFRKLYQRAFDSNSGMSTVASICLSVVKKPPNPSQNFL